MEILIVENDAIVAKMWSMKLSKKHSVRTATSVQQAKDMLNEYRPDVVLLDLRLNGPRHSGLQVYELIRGVKKDDIPIIFITGLAYSVELFQQAKKFVESDSARGLRTTMLEKPVNIDDLFEEVNSLVA